MSRFLIKYKIFLLVFLFFIIPEIQSKGTSFCGYNQKKEDDHINDPRLDHYDIGFYFLDMELTNLSIDVKGNTRIDLNLNDNYSNQLVFDFKTGMTVDSVRINDNIVPFIHVDDLIVIDYIHNSDFNQKYQVSVSIFHHGTPELGMYEIKTDHKGEEIVPVLYSITEPYHAKYWFPCKQVLSDKADSSYFYVTIPENTKAGSNGLLVNEYSIGNGKKRMEWQSSYPIAYYLISVTVGEFRDYSFYVNIPETGDSVLIQNYLPDSDEYLEEIKGDLHRIEGMMALLSDLWGIYPHHKEKYGHCIAPYGGGMEHQTMSTMSHFEFALTMHELAHSWFGNYVTCASWQDIWVNEGFATYSVFIGNQFLRSKNDEIEWLVSTQNAAKMATSGSIYVPYVETDEKSRIYDNSLTYKKSAFLVHMMRYIIDNDDIFFEVQREFLTQYGNATATGEDFRRILEEKSGIDFEPFFREWYYGEGFPVYNIAWAQDDDDDGLFIECLQTTTTNVTPLFTIPLEFKIIYEDQSETVFRKEIDANLINFVVPVDKKVNKVIPNPEMSILADVYSVNDKSIMIENNRYKVFPNPSDGNFYFLSDMDSDYMLELYNISGEELWTNRSNETLLNLDFSGLAPGVYFLKITTKNYICIEKLIIR